MDKCATDVVPVCLHLFTGYTLAEYNITANSCNEKFYTRKTYPRGLARSGNLFTASGEGGGSIIPTMLLGMALPRECDFSRHVLDIQAGPSGGVIRSELIDVPIFWL